MDTTLYTRLSTHPALTALVGSRIFPVLPSPDSLLPYVVYTRTGTEDVYTLQGASGLKTYTYVIDGWGVNHDDTRAVLDVIATRLRGWRDTTVQGCFLDDDSLTVEEAGYHGQQTYRIFAS